MLAVLISGPAAAEDLPDPATVRARLKTVAVTPLRAPPDLPDRATVQARIERDVEERLAAAGLVVIPAAEMRRIEDEVRVALGGYYDPRTGKRDEQKFKSYESHVSSEFRRLHPADAWVEPLLISTRAESSGGTAEWHGIQDRANGTEMTLGSLFTTPAVHGTLPAFSLAIIVKTPDGESLYARAGGLQLLDYIEAGDAMMSIDIVYAPVEPTAFMSDPLRIDRSLSLALDPLLYDDDTIKQRRRTQEKAWKAVALSPRAVLPVAAPPAQRQELVEKCPKVTYSVAAPETPDANATRDRYAAAMGRVLTAAGFQLADPSAYANAWTQAEASVGGFYDSMTGLYLEDRQREAIRKALEQSRESAPADCILLAEFVARDAHIEAGRAEWDGAEVKLSNNVGGALFDKSRAFSGNLPASSLEVVVVDANGTRLHEGYGGIGLRKRFKGGGLLSGGGFEDLPPQDWYADPARDEPAVKQAIRPLLPP